MTRPKILDLYSGAGGCAAGYRRAGFDVVGVDIHPQPRYAGDDFIQDNAVTFLARLVNGDVVMGYSLTDFTAIHASPMCQGYSVTQRIHGYTYPQQVDTIRALLERTGKPYIIENVPGAPLDGITLNGLMFGLKVVRDRVFETNFPVLAPPAPRTKVFTNSSRGYSAFRNGATHITVAGNNFDPKDGAEAMGIGWMTRPELAEAIPPAYAEYMGGWLMNYLQRGG